MRDDLGIEPARFALAEATMATSSLRGGLALKKTLSARCDDSPPRWTEKARDIAPLDILSQPDVANTRAVLPSRRRPFVGSHMRTTSLIIGLSLILASSSAWAGSRVCYDLEEVNVPGDDGVVHPGTSWWSVNNRGVFAGDYCVDADCTEIRSAIYDSRDGSIETFQVPGYTDNIDNPRINDRGEIVGVAWNYSADGIPLITFVRYPDGTIDYVDIPGFVGQDINNVGEIAGFVYNFSDGTFQGAIVSGSDYTDVEYYDIAGADQTSLWGINDAGHLLPSIEGADVFPGYISGVDRGRGFDELVWPSGYEAGSAWAINNKGQIAGALLDADTGAHPGFVLDKWGRYSLVWWGDAADMNWTAVLDINDHGVLAGTFDRYEYGFVGWPAVCSR